MGCALLPTEYLVISYVVILLHKEKASKEMPSQAFWVVFGVFCLEVM